VVLADADADTAAQAAQRISVVLEAPFLLDEVFLPRASVSRAVPRRRSLQRGDVGHLAGQPRAHRLGFVRR
jgi:hypothetical protein